MKLCFKLYCQKRTSQGHMQFHTPQNW